MNDTNDTNDAPLPPSALRDSPIKIEFDRDHVPTLRESLDAIAKIIMHSNTTEIAHVLRAMRGPDNENGNWKQVTTVPIRYTAFGDVGGVFGNCWYEKWGTESQNAIAEALGSGQLKHFGYAIRRAARALGLDVFPL